MAMLSLLLCIVSPICATVTGTYNSTTKSLVFNGTGELDYNCVRGISGYLEAENVSIGSGITTIGTSAFQNTNITSVTIPATVTKLCPFAFADCKKLSSIIIASSSQTLTIQQYCFARKTAESSSCCNRTFQCYRQFEYTQAFSYEYIGSSGLFYGDTKLTNVTLGSYVQEIPIGTFDGCYSLSGVSISGASRLTKIGINAFQGCTQLTSVSFPSSLKVIDSGAFYNCHSLTSLTIPASVTSINSGAFESCHSLTNITLASSSNDLTIYSTAFTYCGSSNGLTFNWNRPFNTTGIFESNKNLKKVIVGSNVKIIPATTFKGCTNLTTLDLSNATSLTTINESAFDGCTSLSSATLPSSLQRVGDYAFRSTALTSATFSYDVTSIGEEAFYNCNSLSTATIKGRPTIRNNAFPSTTNIINEFNTLTGWKSYYAHLGETETVTSLYIPNDNIANAGYTLSSNLLVSYPNVTEVTFGGDVTTIGNYIFLATLNRPSKIETVILEGQTIDIGKYAFRNNTLLSSIVFAWNIKSVGDYAFANTAITKASLTYCTSIGKSAFQGCTSLKTVTTSTPLTTIDNTSFDGCSNLTELTFNSPDLINNVTCTTTTNFATIFGGHLTTLYLGNNITNIKECAFYGSTTLESVTLPSSLNSMETSAFEGCTNLTKLNANCAIYLFKNRSAENTFAQFFPYLKEVVFGSNVLRIGAYSFDNSAKKANALEKITFLGTNTQVGKYAFRSCTNLQTIEGSVKSVDEYSFCSAGIKSIEITNDESIENNAFMNCSNLESATLPSNLTSIGQQAFYGCTSLKEITIPSNVTTIGEEAFMNCRKLNSITCLNPNPIAIDYDMEIFQYIPLDAKLLVPSEGYHAYKSAPVWEDFFDVFGYDGIMLVDSNPYTRTADEEVPMVRYSRYFSEKTVGNWQCFYVPFSFDITEELAENYDFAMLYTTSYKDTNGDGMFSLDEPIVFVISKMPVNSGLMANKPFFIRAKSKGELKLDVVSPTLKKAANGMVKCSNTFLEYYLTGVYEPTNIRRKYTLDVNGQITQITTDTNLNQYRWYLSGNINSDGYWAEDYEARKLELFVEGEGDPTGITDLDSASSALNPQQIDGDIFSLDGRKVSNTANLKRGIYIVNGKKVFIK